MSARGAGECVRPSVWPISCASTTNKLRPRRRLRDQRSSPSKCASPRRGRKACARAPPENKVEGQGEPRPRTLSRRHRLPRWGCILLISISVGSDDTGVRAGEQMTQQWTLQRKSTVDSVRGQTAWVPILDLLFTSCVMLGRQLNLSDNFPDLKMGMMVNFFLIRMNVLYILRTVPNLGIINIGYP